MENKYLLFFVFAQTRYQCKSPFPVGCEWPPREFVPVSRYVYIQYRGKQSRGKRTSSLKIVPSALHACTLYMHSLSLFLSIARLTIVSIESRLQPNPAPHENVMHTHSFELTLIGTQPILLKRNTVSFYRYSTTRSCSFLRSIFFFFFFGPVCFSLVQYGKLGYYESLI